MRAQFTKLPSGLETRLIFEFKLKTLELKYFLEKRRSCFLLRATSKLIAKDEFIFRKDLRSFEIGEIDSLTHNCRCKLLHLKVLIKFRVVGNAISVFRVRFVFTYNHQVN